MTNDPFILAGKHYNSRLLVGTGRYQTPELMKAAVEASGAEIITVALRRMDLSATGKDSVQSLLPPSKYTYLANSAGCYTAEEAVRTLKLARELGGWKLVKLEVIGDRELLTPDMDGTLKAAEILVADGFAVMAYATDDAAGCKRLEDAGCVAVMPLASPIGSGLGIVHPERIAKIVSQSKIPVLVDAGIGTASDACIAMELGCDAVLLNSALSDANDPVMMAAAMKVAVEAGRAAYLAGRMPKRPIANPSSPERGKIG
jgi:thiazole synthase